MERIKAFLTISLWILLIYVAYRLLEIATNSIADLLGAILKFVFPIIIIGAVLLTIIAFVTGIFSDKNK